MTVEPAWPSLLISPTLTSGGIIVFSFWSPSRGPTSTILTGILLLAAVEYVPARTAESESPEWIRRGETIALLTALVAALRDMSDGPIARTIVCLTSGRLGHGGHVSILP
jgi:hypothetical protein